MRSLFISRHFWMHTTHDRHTSKGLDEWCIYFYKLLVRSWTHNVFWLFCFVICYFLSQIIYLFYGISGSTWCYFYTVFICLLDSKSWSNLCFVFELSWKIRSRTSNLKKIKRDWCKASVCSFCLEFAQIWTQFSKTKVGGRYKTALSTLQTAN